MEWDRIERNWPHFKGNALRHWRKLTLNELETIAGSRAELATHLERAYGVSREQAEKELASWQQAQKERDFLK
jgi:uncharacterized protein YjbJ (UPF0337 family)